MDRSVISFLKACPHCARTFDSDSLKRHVAICLKASRRKKREVFDSITQRWKNDKEDYKFTRVELPMARPNKKKEQVVVEQKKDKEPKVENNVVTPRPEVQNKKKQVANKKVKPANQDGNKQEVKMKRIMVQLQTVPSQKDKRVQTLSKTSLRSSPLSARVSPLSMGSPPSTDRSSTIFVRSSPSTERSSPPKSELPLVSRRFVPNLYDTALQTCVHCGRSFNRKAYDSHVAWCREKYSRTFDTTFQTIGNEEAKQRMNRRVNYKPPMPKSARK